MILVYLRQYFIAERLEGKRCQYFKGRQICVDHPFLDVFWPLSWQRERGWENWQLPTKSYVNYQLKILDYFSKQSLDPSK